MRHYALALVNKTTGEIEHIATSQAPLPDERVGHPEGHEVTHQLIRFEFDAEPDNGRKLFRARQALKEFEMTGSIPSEKASPNAAVRSKTGRAKVL